MSNEAIEVQGGFADLGLETPGAVELPSYGVPAGVHQAVLVQARFVQKNDDPNKKNLELTYEVREANNPATGKKISERKPCNPSDTPQVKGYLVERLMQLGVERAEMPTLNVKSLEGKTVYITVVPQRNNPQYTQVQRVQLNNDAEFIGAPATNSAPPAGAVSADSLSY